MEGDPRQGRDTGQQAPLRDWQRETWYGPYPVSEDPFDEPEDAPELRELRSEELNNRSGEFWETQTSGYSFGKKQEGPAENPDQSGKQGKSEKRKKKPPESKASRRKLFLILIITLTLTALGLILFFAVFTVQTIHVEGNEQVSDSEIIRLSGIRKGMPLASLNADGIESGIEQNPVLRFRYLKKDYPSTVTLAVREREACCWMTWNGILYTMDKQRFVLHESEILPRSMSEQDQREENDETREARDDADRIEGTMVRVDGLKVRSGALTGQRLVLESQEQQETFTALFLEMRVLDCVGLIRQVDLSNPDSLLMTTRDGFTITMGNSQNIHAKLRSMLLTRQWLIRENHYSGVINVTLPENPIYSPKNR